MSSVALTVLFSTRNGENVLSRTLEAYCRLESPLHAWKIVIVDNGSEDLTSTILGSYKKRLPLEILQQPIAGKNRSLNCGLTVCEGRLIIITDDDAIPNPSFLTAWSKSLDKNMDYELFGGSIDPFFESPPPKWMAKHLSQLDNMLFALRDLPEGPIAASAIFGPNMAVRNSVFEKGFRFNENIGPNGSDPNYPMGSETEFCVKVARSGIKSWFAKEPRVQHIIRSSQLTRSYWAQRAYRHGRGIARRIRESGEAPPPNVLRPAIIDKLSLLRHRLQMFSPLPFQRFNSVCAYHWRRGFRDEQAKGQTTTF